MEVEGGIPEDEEHIGERVGDDEGGDDGESKDEGEGDEDEGQSPTDAKTNESLLPSEPLARMLEVLPLLFVAQLRLSSSQSRVVRQVVRASNETL